MSTSSRASELFSGENWQVIYEAYTTINFNASDPPSINQALQTYIQTNYPEQYNDWIVQSEFVALIDLLSWISGVLAFKTDISVRENFMSVAQSKDSILRLARFLSYNPSRNLPAQGVLKLVSISTTDDVYDSSGVNLANTVISWNNPDDSNWYERFTAILNDAFVATNPFGIPIQNGTVSGIQTQTYRFNSIASQNNYNFNATVSGSQMNFEFCNGDFTNGGSLFERTPNPSNAFQFYYMNDGNGNGSVNTGFFVMFKQGSTNTTLFNIASPVQNTLLNINTSNINNNDVWVQTVDDSNNVLITWNPIPIMLNQNITYNSLSADQRNIYSIITRDSDQISVRFSDGNFGNAPVGNILTTYRVSNGLVYSINPSDINNVILTLNYTNSNGSSETLSLTFSLQTTISNSSASESITSIQQNAPLVYATQNRMVSGQDYNTFPLQTNLAVKLKALNRVYSGQSRYIDLNDPTGFYQDLSIFADDGIIFSQNANSYAEIPTALNITTSNVIADYIQPILESSNTKNAINSIFMQGISSGSILAPSNMTWNQSSASLYSTTGWFNVPSNLISQGTLLKISFNGITQWIGVESVSGAITYQPPSNTAGPVTLSAVVPTGAVVVAIIPAYISTLSPSTITSITNNLASNISFALVYDYVNGWIVTTAIPVSSLTQTINPGTTQINIMEVDFMTVLWRINSIGLQYVFESITTVEWFDDGVSAIDQETGQSVIDDTITILGINKDLNSPGAYSLNDDYVFDIGDIWTYQNGEPEPRRTFINFSTTSGNFINNPDAFLKIIPPSVSVWTANTYYTNGANVSYNNTVYQCITSHTSGSSFDSANWIQTLISSISNQNSYLFWGTNSNNLVEPNYDLIVFSSQSLLNGAIGTYAPSDGSEAFVITGLTNATNNSFWTYSASNGNWTQDFSQLYSYQIGRGPNIAKLWISNTNELSEINSSTSFSSGNPVGDQLKFQWKHYASYNDRIDPASQAIQDMFVLTASYDAAVRLWIRNGCVGEQPAAPTELELSLAFTSMENYKMFSDTLIWHPVKYKLLFGSAANIDLQMQFKVVPSPATTMSNGEIQSAVINAINTYFGIQYWDFGDTFYWSELSAYIHIQLAGVISSIVIVPMSANSSFGDGFEIPCNPNEIFISCAQVSNVTIISSNTPNNLRIK